MQALSPHEYLEAAPYGSVFHWHEDRTVYTREHLAKWTDKELLLKHYHLTARLDGYNHLSATQTTKDNCILFRTVLAERGIDGVRHCIDMDWWYDAGVRDVWIFYPELKENNGKG